MSTEKENANLFQRYVWLVDTIYSSDGMTFEEINEHWKGNIMSRGEEIPLRTFHNHREAIRNIFDIDTVCARSGGYKYYIGDSNKPDRGGIQSLLLNVFSLNNLLMETKKIKSRILFDKIPNGQRFLITIVETMRDGLTLKIVYQNLSGDGENKLEVKPYCLKEFKRRWYLVAYSDYYESVRIYALDRIKEMKATGNKFKLPVDFDPEMSFYNCFGIVQKEELSFEDILIKVYGKQADIVRDLPLHRSQEELSSNEEYTIFKFYLKPTNDFLQELASHGGYIEIISPKSLSDELTNVTVEMQKK